MPNKKYLIFSALCCLIGTHAFSQGATMGGGGTDSKIKPSTGSNASIGNIFSPSLYNGTANISIPIYDFDAYGISLNYNAAGVKVSEISSPVGLHWQMSAEGSITRQVKDLPDEINSNVKIIYQLGGGVAGGGSDVYTTGLKGKFAQYMGTTPSPENTGRYVDGESDDFMFSVGGLSFTFNIGANGFIFTHPHKNVKIQLLIDGLPVTQMPVQTSEAASYKQNLSFIVTDAQGTKYIFEEGDISIKSYSDGMRSNPGNPVEINYVSRWVIKKIIRSDGSEINYEYLEDSSHMLGGLLAKSYIGLEQLNNVVAISAQEMNIGEDLFSSKRLTAIKYPNNVVASFITSTLPRCDNTRDPVLQEIRIASDDQCTRYVMKQEYVVSAPSNTTSPLNSCVDMGAGISKEPYHRLMLNGIDKVSCDGSVTEHYYTFGYDATRLPSRSSGAQDYFGYYNGQTITANGGELNIPYHTPVTGTPANPYGVTKTENTTYAKAGLLSLVQNAYGGKLTMTYGPNVLSNVLTGLPTDALFMGKDANDGVCIMSMTTSDDFYPGKWMKQEFTYGGGQRFLTGGYFNYPLWDGAANMMFCGSYITPHQLVNGSNHGYSNVTIETKNESGIVLSKREITYSNFKTGNNLSTHISGSNNYYEMPYTDKQYIKDWELGLPLVINEYDQSGFITTKTTNIYNSIPDYTSMAGKVENTKKLNVVKVNGDLMAIATENYRPYTGVSLLASTTVRKYLSDVSFINDVVTYDYDSRNNPINTTTKNSLGEYSYVRNVYNYDVSGPGVLYGGLPGEVLYDMTANGIEKQVGTERWLKGSTNPPYNDQLMDASISKFSYAAGKILPKKAFILQSLDPIGYTAYTGMSMGGPLANPYARILTAYNTTQAPANFQTTTEVTLVDTKGRTTETKNMDLNSYQSMIWDATGNIAASVQNARYQDIGFTSFESAIYNDPTLYTGNEIISNGRFTYLQKGLSALDPISGKAVYRLNATNYIKSPVLTAGKQYTLTFWCKGTVPSITGAGLSGLPTEITDNWGDWKFYSASFTAGANTELSFASGTPTSVDEIRLFPAGAIMNSNVFTPLFGVSSSTDATGRITYFEYDLFGRQILTRNQEKSILSKTEYLIGQ